MPHFVPTDLAIHCDECGEPIEKDALVMHVYIYAPAMTGAPHRNRRRVNYCKPCGKLYLESQWKTGSLSQ